MKRPTTIKGYISALKNIECTGVLSLKGCEKLTDEQKEVLMFLEGDISNGLNEFLEL